MIAATAAAITDPPYEVFPYVAESTDNPPVNYMKVCEPGVSGEANASYIVLGISFPRTYQAVNDFSGDLVIPAYIDGLPVRKVNEAAFITCTLRSVKFPHTLREVGARAFAECWYLTNVTFAAGVTTIGDGAFSNCVSLTSITFPKTLSRLGEKCFQGCVELKDVYFLGNAPRLNTSSMTDKSYLGESIFRQWGYYERFKVHINRNTYGWIAPYETGVPEKWPVDFGFMQAHRTVAESGESGGSVPSGSTTFIQEVESPYALSRTAADRTVASVTVNSDCSIDTFVLKDGKVYDSLIRIENTADHAVKLTLPAGYVYETFKGTSPLTIPAKSRNMLSITRTDDKTFLVSREELATVN